MEGLGSSQSGSTGQKVLDQKARWSYASTGTTRLYGDDDDGSGLFGNLGLYIFVRRSRMAYKRGRGDSLFPRGLKSASKQAIAVLIKKRFAFTGF